jgi:amino acid adenylation domain-containing protein
MSSVTTQTARIQSNLVGRIHSLAESSPQALAVAGGGVRLTYAELEVKGNRLANYLRSLGVSPGSFVAIALKRSPEMVIAALAVLKVGAAYLPLDVDYPAERLKFILNDSGVVALIVREPFSPKLPPGPFRVIDLDHDAVAIARAPAEFPPLSLEADSLAYVIYTSGSTGQPKGVDVSHSSLQNLIEWHQGAFGVTAEDRATQIASPGFDAAVWEIWPYMTAGASIHMPEETARIAPETLRDWILENEITVSFVPTALAERLIALPWPARTSLRLLLTGADLLRRYPPPNLPFVLVNNYGPTECTVVATSCAVHANTNGDRLPPIGWPISNVQTFVLDQSMRPVASGQPGELFLAGAGLAQGYHNRPDLTAERFLAPNGNAGPRLYRTGDLVRQLPDGQFAYLGRIDEQIKVRGYRVEPNEIVIAIDRHPEVSESAVVAWEDATGEKRLVAYVAAHLGQDFSEASLQEHLRVSLPEYMVPRIFVHIKQIPRTVNGKVDRAALPDPAANANRAEYVAPRTPAEERLAAILASLMGLDRVGVNENFFLLGGHSLLGTQVISRVRDSFGVELPLRSLFDAPTISDLSAEIERLILALLESGNRK